MAGHIRQTDGFLLGEKFPAVVSSWAEPSCHTRWMGTDIQWLSV